VKKLAAGCLVVVVIGVVALGVALYFGYRTFSPMIDGATTVLEQAKAAAAESDRLENKTRYVAPASGELTEAQVRRLLAVHDRTRSSLGPKWAELQTQAYRFQQQAKTDARELSFPELVAMVRSLGSIIVEARRANVDALNAEQFSSSEYTWVTLRAYEAAGLEAVEGIDWSEIQAAIKDGADRVGVREPRVPEPDIPERNRELVRPHLDALKAWLPLTVLGF
jgi:hypothetical protein